MGTYGPDMRAEKVPHGPAPRTRGPGGGGDSRRRADGLSSINSGIHDRNKSAKAAGPTLTTTLPLGRPRPGAPGPTGNRHGPRDPRGSRFNFFRGGAGGGPAGSLRDDLLLLLVGPESHGLRRNLLLLLLLLLSLPLNTFAARGSRRPGSRQSSRPPSRRPRHPGPPPPLRRPSRPGSGGDGAGRRGRRRRHRSRPLNSVFILRFGLGGAGCGTLQRV